MSENKSNTKKYVKILKKLLPLVGISLFVYIISIVGAEKIVTSLFSISPIIYVIVGVALFFKIILHNYAWRIILKKQKIKLSYFKSLKIQLIGQFYSYVTFGKWGMVSKVIYLKDETKEPFGKLFINILIKMTLGSFAFYVILLIGLFFIFEQFPNIFLIVISYILIIVGSTLFFVKKERGEKTFHILIKYFVPKKMKKYIANFTKTFYDDFPRLRDLIYPFSIFFLIQIISVIQMYIVALSLGIEVPFHLFYIFYSIAAIVSSIPVSVGSLGTKVATLYILFSPLGVELDKIMAFALVNTLIFSGLMSASLGLILSVTDAVNDKKSFILKKPFINFKN